jgi:ParB family chromosome partitioning protein
MSFTPNTEHKASRSDLYSCDPRDIDVDWSKNLARSGKEPEVDDDLKQLGLSMRPKNQGGNGQLQPVMVRPLSDRRLQLIGGFRRMRAALWLLESGVCPDFQIQCILRRLNDQEAAVSNLAENLDRKDIGPVELAHAYVRSRGPDPRQETRE